MVTLAKPDYAHILRHMNGAIRTLEMYPPGHPATLKATEKPFHALQEIFKTTDFLTISQVKDRIIVNGTSIEGASLPERMLEEFKNENINSLTITKTINQEGLGKFLSFFIKPLEKDAKPENLQDFLKRNQISSIQIDQLRYELVSENEVVVNTEVLEGADLKAQISAIMKDNPDLLRDILLNKSVEKHAVAQRFGSDVNLHQLSEEIGRQLKDLSDDEVMMLLTSSLEQKLKASEAENQDSTLNEMVDLVHKLLEDREKRKLLPEIKKMLSERGIVKKEHLDFLFEEKWLKSQAVLDELMQMIEKLGTEEVDFERFLFLWQRVISSNDSQIKSYAMDKLLSKLDSENDKTRTLAVSALEKALHHFMQEKMESEFSHLKDQLERRIKDPLLPAGVLECCSRLAKVIFLELIQQHRFKEADTIAAQYAVRLCPDVTTSEEVKKVSQDFVQQVSTDSVITALVSQMKEGVPFHQVKSIEDILEFLDGNRVAEKLLHAFTLDDRVARMSALRVLSKLGKSSVSALFTLLSHPNTLARSKDTALLSDEQWYKVRNTIYVLGNIPDEQSVTILAKLSLDQDPRVRLEVVKALEKIAKPESIDALLGLLQDENQEVRKSTIASLTTLADPRCLEPLFQHLRQNQKDRSITLSAISKIGGNQSIALLLRILWEKDGVVRDLPSRQKDEIKVATLGILAKTASSQWSGEIAEFVRHRRKGLRSLLVKDRVIESAERALRIIKNRSNGHPQEVQSRRTLETQKVD
ncbi:MAG: HEAT repeat domain-containing protein [Candidatus Zixiibacteriota bacterium]